MSILRMAARMLALLWVDKRTCEVESSWIFSGKEIVFKRGVRVTVELLEDGETEWLFTRGNVSVTEMT